MSQFDARNYVPEEKRRRCPNQRCELFRKHHCWADFKHIEVPDAGEYSIETIKSLLTLLNGRVSNPDITSAEKKLILVNVSEILCVMDGTNLRLDNQNAQKFRKKVKALKQLRNDICHSHHPDSVPETNIQEGYKNLTEVFQILQINTDE